MPSTAARSSLMRSAFGVTLTIASSRSVNREKSDQVLPLKRGGSPGSAPVCRPSFWASSSTDVSAPVSSTLDAGLSTCRSMSTWNAASAVLYEVFEGRSSRWTSAGMSEHAARTSATSGRSRWIRVTLHRWYGGETAGGLAPALALRELRLEELTKPTERAELQR